MRILVNHSPDDTPYLGQLAFILKRLGHTGITTDLTLSIGDLNERAAEIQAKGIVVCNPLSLAKMVDQAKPTLDAWRGSIIPNLYTTLVVNPLQHINSVDYGRFLLEKDLEKLSSYDKNNRSRLSFTILDSLTSQREAILDLSNCVAISYDIETITLEDEDSLEVGDTIITCCSWTGIRKDLSLVTYTLPLTNFQQEYYCGDAEYMQAISFMRRVNALEIPKIMHNGKYDCLHSIVYGATPNNYTLDTMGMMHSLYSEMPKDLSFVASLYLDDYIQWKHLASHASKHKDLNGYLAYNARDSWITARVFLKMIEKYPRYAIKNYQMNFKFTYPTIYTEFEGIKIDNKKREEIKIREERVVSSSLQSLRTILSDCNFNPSSPKQVAYYLYDILGAGDAHIGKKAVKGGEKKRIDRGTDKKNLVAISSQHPILLRTVTALLSYKKSSKAISTYINCKQKKGRMLYNIDPFGTETGRFSCRGSSFWCGSQIQNQPQYTKEYLVSDEGFTMAEIDNSQSEARCTAYLSQETSLASALETPDKDFYTSLGTLFFGIPYTEVTKELRNLVIKKIVHGTNYMMGVATFIENAGEENLLKASKSLGVKIVQVAENTKNKKEKDSMTMKEYGKFLLESYHKPFPRVRKWYVEIKEEIIRTRHLISPLGWTRRFFGDVDKNHKALNSAVAHAPQNLSATILNIGLWKVWKLVKKHHGALRLKAQIHDSVLFQYRDDREDILYEVLGAMDNPVSVHNRILRIPVDCKTGKTWASMEKLAK